MCAVAGRGGEGAVALAVAGKDMEVVGGGQVEEAVTLSIVCENRSAGDAGVPHLHDAASAPARRDLSMQCL